MLKPGENNQFAGKLRKECNQLNRGLPRGMDRDTRLDSTCWTIHKLLLPFLLVDLLLELTTGVVVGSGESVYVSEVL